MHLDKIYLRVTQIVFALKLLVDVSAPIDVATRRRILQRYLFDFWSLQMSSGRSLKNVCDNL